MSNLPLPQPSFSPHVLPLVLWTIPFLVLLTACAGGGSDSRLPDPANRLKSDHAPTPYSAKQIREACPHGRQDQYRLEQAGRPTTIRITTFGKGDDESVEILARQEDEDGHALGRPSTASARWVELQAHASFPSKDTHIFEDRCQVPAGSFDCWVYRVRRRENGKLHEFRYWFAKELPGPPVLLEEESAGTRTLTMTLLRHN